MSRINTLKTIYSSCFSSSSSDVFDDIQTSSASSVFLRGEKFQFNIPFHCLRKTPNWACSSSLFFSFLFSLALTRSSSVAQSLSFLLMLRTIHRRFTFSFLSLSPFDTFEENVCLSCMENKAWSTSNIEEERKKMTVIMMMIFSLFSFAFF